MRQDILPIPRYLKGKQNRETEEKRAFYPAAAAPQISCNCREKHPETRLFFSWPVSCSSRIFHRINDAERSTKGGREAPEVDTYNNTSIFSSFSFSFSCLRLFPVFLCHAMMVAVNYHWHENVKTAQTCTQQKKDTIFLPRKRFLIGDPARCIFSRQFFLLTFLLYGKGGEAKMSQ